MKITKYVVKKPFKDFLPEPEDFGTKHENFDKLKNDQFLVKAEYISTDPYLRSFANKRAVPYDQFGFQVGNVVESLNPEYPVKMTVVSHSGWRDYAVLNGQPDDMFGIKPYDPQIGKLPLSLALGALGMPGITAYLGFLEICKPRTGDVVCVSSAAGTVGSLVGQIAKMKGCVVIGFAGSPEKVQYLRDELGFNYAYDYKAVKDVKATILSVCNGIDCYFDNVGGELSAGIVQCMKRVGRIAVCGSISTYGSVVDQKMPIIPHNVKVQSFSFTQWDWEQQMAAIQQLKAWMQIGSIKAKETVVQGFDQLPTALIGLLRGDNIGKVVVKV
ncbi:prostaglandin reductase 1-like [Spodoptera frugiperda]|uniref:15-oxoprostaglandin 13-reductase n=1 Tax=Spodoptera frugiperda TaxID=7108 RepID=A0A2H1VFA9_SPOFR|nr:prostaglandin reductase 1-like [Spodoptera frugiperda]